MSSDLKDAVAAIDAAIAVCRSVREKTKQLTQEQSLGRSARSQAARELVELGATILKLENRKAHLIATGVVTSTPSAAQTAQMVNLAQQVENLPLAQAVKTANLDVFRRASADAWTFSLLVMNGGGQTHD